MIESFRLTNINETVLNKEELPDSQSEQVTPRTDDRVLILNRRFAMGEITEQESSKNAKNIGKLTYKDYSLLPLYIMVS